MMTVDQMIEVLTAYKAGKKVQVKLMQGWADVDDPKWSFDVDDYRVKPEPKVLWVNEYKNGSGYGHTTRENAEGVARESHTRIAVRYVEMPDEDAS